ncbi:aminoacyl-tRNA hydrolase [Humibacter sp.]|uniref:aminoacyl-tRNA hydrolase n=1 Tax=Humibacter sp. TaxID=1940291 RepID=UPI003F7EA02C
MAEQPWLIVGLGNPGAQYERTRHNIGQLVVDELARRASAVFKSHTTNAWVAVGRIVPGGPRLVLAKPNTYMNVSGGPVAQLMRFYSLQPERLIVVHDELDIPFDTIKLKSGGGHGGHNGVRDIASALRSADFTRVRVGVGRPPGRTDAADHVLSPFTSEQRQVLPSLISDAADAVELVTTDGLLVAQQRFHSPS